MEIVMDIETLEIFDVIDSDNQMAVSEVEEYTEEMISEDVQMEVSEASQYLDTSQSVIQLMFFDAVNLASFEDSS